jgi:hypothetical protein
VGAIKVISASSFDSQSSQNFMKSDSKYIQGRNDGPIFGNGISGAEAETIFYVYKIAPNGNYFLA